MSTKCRNLIPGTLVVLAVLFLAFLVIPASYAADPVELMPVEDKDVPEGSQIPDWRIYETEEKVKAYKAKMREMSLQGKKGLPQTEPQKPNGNQ